MEKDLSLCHIVCALVHPGTVLQPRDKIQTGASHLSSPKVKTVGPFAEEIPWIVKVSDKPFWPTKLHIGPANMTFRYLGCMETESVAYLSYFAIQHL